MDLKGSETRNVFDFGYILGILERLIPPTTGVAHDRIDQRGGAR